jgi:DNA (cytosine-5)-methyltransferase 1
MRVLELFAGVGGFSVGLERTGKFQTVQFCEIDPFAQKVLAKNWPGVPIHDDVATLEPIGPVDLVTAGFPCQDISLAGQGAGLAGSRSGLFWHTLRTASLVGQPRLLLENVAALLGRGMGEVLGALASVGYDAEWHCIPASAVGAPHRRDRIWIVAHANKERSSALRGERPNLSPEDIGRRNDDCGGASLVEWQRPIRGAGEAGTGADADRIGIQGEQPRLPDAQEWSGPLSGPLGSLLASHGGQWPSEPSISRVAYGLPDQSHRIAALGNAVVPKIPELIGHAILQAEGRA